MQVRQVQTYTDGREAGSCSGLMCVLTVRSAKVDVQQTRAPAGDPLTLPSAALKLQQA